MTLNIKQIITTVLLISLSAIAVAAVSTDAQNAAFEKWDQDWSKYNAEGNRAELEKIYADDYRAIGYTSLGENDKKATIDNAIKNVGSNTSVKTSSHNYLITCTPNTVAIAHRNTNVVTTDGKEASFYSRTTHVLEKRNGNWQVVTSISQYLADDFSVIISMEFDGEQAYINRDLDWFKKNTADNFVGINRSGAKYDKTQLIESFEQQFKDLKTKYESVRSSDVDIRVEGNMAFITGVREVDGVSADGKPMNFKMRYSDTFIKKDGQ